MEETVMKAPVLNVVLASGVDAPAGTVSVTFGFIDKKKFQLDFSAQCVPMTIAALAAEMGKLVAALPADKAPALQGIAVTSTQLAMKDDGTVSIFLRLESGAELPLDFRLDDLTRLRQQIDEAIKVGDRKTRH